MALYRLIRENEAIENDWRSYHYASKELKSHKDLALFGIQRSWEVLQFLDDHLHDDLEVMSAAVAQRGEALRYASDRLRASAELQRRAAEDGYEEPLREMMDHLRKRWKTYSTRNYKT